MSSHTDDQIYIKALQEFRTLVYVAELRCYAMLTIINIATCAWKILVKYVNIRSSFLVLVVSIYGALYGQLHWQVPYTYDNIDCGWHLFYSTRVKYIGTKTWTLSLKGVHCICYASH